MKLVRLVAVVVGVLGVGGLGCGGGEDGSGDERCVFEGRYEIGLVPRNGCNSLSAPYDGGEMAEQCSTAIDQLGVTGAVQRGFISCQPGSPVVECTGFMSDSTGCQWDVYLRRIGGS